MIASALTTISINANKSSPNTESALQAAVEAKADIILVQEPWFFGPKTRPEWINLTSVAHSSYTQILPNHWPQFRPRTLTYVSRTFKPSVSLARESPIDTDIQILQITEGEETLEIINIYNQSDQGNSGQKTAERCLYTQDIHTNTILCGDFNSHHPWWNPRVEDPDKEAQQLVEWIENRDFELLNKPGEATFLRTNAIRPSVIDLAFTSRAVANKITGFNINHDIISDHHALQITIKASNEPTVANPTQQCRYNTRKADWKLFQESLITKANASFTPNSEWLNYLPNVEHSKAILEGTSSLATTLPPD